VKDLVARLLVVLEAEHALYVRLRDLLRREREVLGLLDAKRLERVAREKEELADEGRLLEESRLHVARELAGSLGVASERPRLAELCARLGAEAAPLRVAHNRLVVLIGASRELLEANSALAGESLAQVQATLRVLGGLLPEDARYAPGTGTRPASSGRLLRQTA
jgi:hypothetical protein